MTVSSAPCRWRGLGASGTHLIIPGIMHVHVESLKLAPAPQLHESRTHTYGNIGHVARQPMFGPIVVRLLVCLCVRFVPYFDPMGQYVRVSVYKHRNTESAYFLSSCEPSAKYCCFWTVETAKARNMVLLELQPHGTCSQTLVAGSAGTSSCYLDRAYIIFWFNWPRICFGHHLR